MKPSSSTVILYLAAAAFLSLSSLQAAPNIIPNPGFEDGTDLWRLYVAPNSEEAGCEFGVDETSPHAGAACAKMEAAGNANFSLSPETMTRNQKVAAVQPGERWKLTFWIRTTNASSKASPAFFVRVPLFAEWEKLPQVLYIGLNGMNAIRDASDSFDSIQELDTDLPLKWTKIESVFEIPASTGATQLGRPEFYARGVMGMIFLDDISLVQETASAELSPASNTP